MAVVAVTAVVTVTVVVAVVAVMAQAKAPVTLIEAAAPRVRRRAALHNHPASKSAQ